jgi:hypothetical protein
MSIQKLKEYIGLRWKPMAMYVAMFVILGAALFSQLGTLTPGYSQSEADTYHASLSFKHILDNPINAPYMVVVRGLSYISHDNLLATRLVSTLCGLVILAIFAELLYRWHDMRTSIFGTLLFGLSASFLHVARLGTPEVLLYGLFFLTVCGYWAKRTNGKLPLFICFVTSSALLYVPGMIWFIFAGIIWQHKTIDRLFKKHLGIVSIGSLLFVACLAPLGWAISKDHSLIKPLLGLPDTWPTIWQLAKNIINVPVHLFLHNAANPVSWLGTAPVLDIFSLTMLIIGSYLYIKNFKLLRTPLFITFLAIMTGLVALGGSVTLTVIMPFIYLIAAAGVAQLLTQWLTVFPRNPIARSLGLVSVAVLIGFACIYQITHYFVGWPQAAATHQTFTIQKP